MGNTVTYTKRPELPELDMSNGLTTVFASVLLLAASVHARTANQRNLAIWFAELDQTDRGLGTVGFDVSELPWQAETFRVDREFLLRVIDAAIAGTGWERLGYQPKVDSLEDCLTKFRTLVDEFVLEDAVPPRHAFPPASPAWCDIHQVYRHAYGCLICNDALIA